MKVQLLTEGSPDCPLIRIFEYDESQLSKLRLSISTLAASEGIVEMFALECESDVANKICFRVTQKAGAFLEDCLVNWGGPTDYWAEVVALISEMLPISPSRNRYQWLTGPNAHYESEGISVLLSEIDGGLW